MLASGLTNGSSDDGSDAQLAAAEAHLCDWSARRKRLFSTHVVASQDGPDSRTALPLIATRASTPAPAVLLPMHLERAAE